MQEVPKAMAELWDNQILFIALFSWAAAQIIKVIIILIQERRLAWNFLVSSGGMPSSHSSTVTSLATAIGLTTGISSVYFAIAVVLAMIVMYDAAGVRQSVGQHSMVLNRIIKEFSFKHPRPEFEKAFREFIGHTPLQVIIGACLGIAVAWLWIFISRP
ncbi:MAG TPA: divergent PAP2 family protein [Dehalococcoidales bacterium]|nr:divergent PAP2 family protein [Dehalococcoidales bacterium]